MANPDPNFVVPEMRQRLNTNRSGKLTPGQWMDIVLQPLTPMLLVLFPGVLIILPRLWFAVARGGWFLLILLVVVLGSSFVMRAQRYARAPIRFIELQAQGEAPLMRFWRATLLKDDNGKSFRFNKRLAPRPILEKERRYLVYYLLDHDEPILLSLAPLDHPDSSKWQPDRMFYTRQERRSKKKT